VQKLNKNLVMIHGAGPRHYRSLKDGTGDWQAKLPSLLGHQFNIVAPQMPSPKNPSYEEWKILLDKNLAKLKGEVFFVGHSLGASFLVKYLSQEKTLQKINGLFLVSAPYSTVSGFEAPTDYSIFSSIKKIILYHSLDDVEVPYAHSLLYQSKLNAQLRTFQQQGHYFKKEDFPEIYSDIQSAATDHENHIYEDHL